MNKADECFICTKRMFPDPCFIALFPRWLKVYAEFLSLDHYEYEPRTCCHGFRPVSVDSGKCRLLQSVDTRRCLLLSVWTPVSVDHLVFLQIPQTLTASSLPFIGHTRLPSRSHLSYHRHSPLSSSIRAFVKITILRLVALFEDRNNARQLRSFFDKATKCIIYHPSLHHRSYHVRKIKLQWPKRWSVTSQNVHFQ